MMSFHVLTDGRNVPPSAGHIQLTNRIPKLKKCIERFMLGMVACLNSQPGGIEVELGELKHRDIYGNPLPNSQLFTSQVPLAADLIE